MRDNVLVIIKKSFQEIMEERGKILSTIEEKLKEEQSVENEEEILKLLEMNKNSRADLKNFLKTYHENINSEEEMEYYRTIIDFVRLVYMQIEEDLFERILERAERSIGPLKANKDWILKEAADIDFIYDNK
ncbi:hypothetical protein FFONT_0773 [Fervidicoccus fontis Kam940]|uniref:Uncharacterized protein n=1 Tax=Fervidicoccus fontis (strain DSM 19380 / JCM 18336 / VKM B-2539 / Kam940) TaxID=1163730 RepID=I0A1A4_FERFK|nr:hypothetical protein FFONT_0773 [Fervidicoccus fontis Kam940]